jgi:hypothetical protein
MRLIPLKQWICDSCGGILKTQKMDGLNGVRKNIAASSSLRDES